jgi:cysteine-rich repeat protein
MILVPLRRTVMDSSPGRWWVVCAASVIALTACSPQNNTKQCSANGEIYFCPEGTECGGVQMLCVRPGGCGNGVVEEGEDCDDGNTMSGDGCSPSCRFEKCGNGITDPGEKCDDGNTVSGDGCSSDCKSDESCGNLKIDKDKKDARGRGEVCDDGNNVDGDGCSADCRSTEICGNGIIDVAVGEVCDDGPGGSIACSANCRSNLSCNNFAVDPGEECDHGLFGDNNPTGNNNSNDCRADCVLNRCGDGFVDSELGLHHEECDGAPPATPNSFAAVPAETDTCNIDCTQARCGDGKVNKTAGEQCDDSNAVSGDGCSADCKLEFCGDGIVNNGEACDRALTPSTCNLDCTISVCGDGKLNTSAVIPEQCDDGNTAADDGCSPLCQFEHCGNGTVDAQEECDGAAGLQPCSASCHQERCGNGILDHDPGRGVDEQCDDGNTDDNDGCSASCKREFCGDGIVNNGEACDRALTPATCNLDCTISRCGDHKLNTAAAPPEQCDDGGTVDGDGCSAGCTFEHCGNGVVDTGEECDGDAGLQPCSATCHREICGNGILDQNPGHGVNEQCDDGNTRDNDGCSHLCRLEFCGDAIVNNGEDCDRALTPATCNIDCTFSTCGDGKLNPTAVPPEQCDDGGTVDGDGCSASCVREFCGDGIVNNGEACDRGLTPATCNLDCTPSSCGDGKLNTSAVPPEQCDDGNATSGDGCSSVCRLEHCGNGAVDNGEDCDGLLGLQPCSPTCHQERCGNGILDHDLALGIDEQCDDGNTTDGDGCSASCRLEHCGNGVVDPGENCDGTAGLQPCSPSCHQEICGNGILDHDPASGIPEDCDDGNTDDGDGCSASCVFEFCGDGKLNNHEVCDPSVTPATCNLDCTPSICGDGQVNPFAIPPELCDDHNTVGGDGCSATCQTERCGNGILDPGESCDGAIGPQPCSARCQAEICGNGILDRDLARGIDEQCDDGNLVDGDGCSALCKREFCGDNLVNNGEDCDRALTPATCNIDCTLSRCGDSKLNTSAVPPEQCDDGNSTSGDGCSSVCQLEHCGNGALDTGEECDGLLGLQPCSPICRRERCGNGIVEVDPAHGINEQCDNGSTGPNANDDTHSCTSTCQVAVCGDDLVEDGVEQCDDGPDNGDDKDCTSECRISFCGDGLVDSALGAHHEQCDNGQANTDDPVCPYNTSCDRCSLSCTVLVTIVPTCGDGTVNGPQEICDDHNTDACGTCSATCQAVTSQRAIGFIIAVSGAQLVDGQTLTIDDGVNPAVVFEFDDGSEAAVALGHVAVPFTAADDAATVRQHLVDAITAVHTAQLLLITATAEGAVVVSLTHDRPTALGDQPITETVTDPLFLVIGMQGGVGGDCDGGAGCQSNDDCASHSCDLLSHTCDAPPAGGGVLTQR